MTSTLTLRSYLDSRRTTAADWNVTGMGTGPAGWLGKFKIPDDEYDDFLTLAHDHIFTRSKACSLLEKHKPQGPILIDLDFRYAAGGPLRRRFTAEQIREFVAAYADAIARFFDPTEEPLQFFVMLKPTAEADKETHKDGVHIVCPSLTLPPDIQYAIRGYLLQTGVIERIFDSTGMTNPPQDCLDISVIQRNNWFLYGACKPDKAWYKVEYVYTATIPADFEDEGATEPLITADHLEENPADDWNTLELIKLLSIRRGHDKINEITMRTEPASLETEWLQLLSRWGKGSNWAKPKSPGIFAKSGAAATAPPAFSLSGGGGAAGDAISHVVATAPESAGASADEMVQITGLSVRSGPTEKDIKLAYKLVRECLNPVTRARSYHDWVRLGLLLHNIAATPESYTTWMEFSRRVPGFGGTDESVYVDKWKLLPSEAAALQRGVKPLTIATIHHYAREDNYAQYRKIMDKAHTEFAMLNCTGTHVSVAELIFGMYQHEFRCTPLKKAATAASMDWYQYDGNTWRNLKSPMRIRERISNDVRDKYVHAGSDLRRIALSSTDPGERDRHEESIKKLNKLETHLQSSGFKDSVMKEVTEKFYDEEFLQSMNQDATLVGFSNGVLELRHMGPDGQPHVQFRKGRPDDCISFQMGRGAVGLEPVPYMEYDPAHPAPEHLEIMEFFSKIYPDPVLREYCLTLYAACLEGANREQKFYIMTGKGGNGKSKIVDLMSKTFGEYQETLATTALTRKRADAGSANPEMIVLKCKRFVSMMEPDEGEKINTSLMKQLSGEDTLKARGLFQDQDQFVVMARIFMSCNDLPPVSSMDMGTWRRLRVIPHVSTFVPMGDPTDPANNIYPRDPMLDTKINKWRPYFAGLLVWYFENRYLRGGLKEPPQVLEASNRYKEDNDAFAAFCQDCLIREIGAEARANDILTRYKDWNRYNPGKKLLGKKELLQRVTDTYGKPIDPAGKVYGGIRIAEEGEDISGNVIAIVP
jgi:P4 family phage/plasmid primase-like protien